MANPKKPAELPASPDRVFDAILAELRAIRSAIEQPRQTAERENAEFLAGLSTK